MFMTFYLFSANTLARSNNINIDKDVTIAIKAALEQKERKKAIAMVGPTQWNPCNSQRKIEQKLKKSIVSEL